MFAQNVSIPESKIRKGGNIELEKDKSQNDIDPINIH